MSHIVHSNLVRSFSVDAIVDRVRDLWSCLHFENPKQLQTIHLQTSKSVAT